MRDRGPRGRDAVLPSLELGTLDVDDPGLSVDDLPDLVLALELGAVLRLLPVRLVRSSLLAVDER